jgi:hypothetical protein
MTDAATSLISSLKDLEEDVKVEVNCIDDTFTVAGFKPHICYEVELEASDGTVYYLRETRLDGDVLEIERQSLNSEPIVVRELEVV